MTRGRSLGLSGLLIRAEQASLPLAAWLDARAARWQTAAVPVVHADFVSMDTVPSWDAPTLWSGRTPLRTLVGLNAQVARYRRAVSTAAAAASFAPVVRRSAKLLRKLDTLETEHQAHLAMTRHLVESIGFAAENALRYRALSQGGTDALAGDLLRVQALGLWLAVPIDRLAQVQHGRGVGIVVNDVPPIPFRCPTSRVTSSANGLCTYRFDL